MAEKMFVLIEPDESIVKFYNDLWHEKDIEKTTKLFENLNEIDISEYLPKDVFENEKKDEEIRDYLRKEDTENFLRTINKVYHTRVNLNKVDWENNCWNIKSIKESDIDSFINNLHDYTGRYEYSFATKVFSFLNEKEYPILDSISASLLNEYYKKYFKTDEDRKKKWGVYNNYVEDYKALLIKMKLYNISFKEFDVFLWTYGTVINNYWKKCGFIEYESVPYNKIN